MKSKIVNIKDVLSDKQIEDLDGIIRIIGERNFDKFFASMGPDGLVFESLTPNSILGSRFTWVRDRVGRGKLDAFLPGVVDMIKLRIPLPYKDTYDLMFKYYGENNRTKKVGRNKKYKTIERNYLEYKDYYGILSMIGAYNRTLTAELDFEEYEEIYDFFTDYPLPYDEIEIFSKKKVKTEYEDIPNLFTIRKKKEQNSFFQN